MPRTKTGEFNQIAYQNEFNKRNYDRIEIKVPKGRKSSNKSAQRQQGQSVNEFMTRPLTKEWKAGGDSKADRERIRYENMVLRNIFI